MTSQAWHLIETNLQVKFEKETMYRYRSLANTQYHIWYDYDVEKTYILYYGLAHPSGGQLRSIYEIRFV